MSPIHGFLQRPDLLVVTTDQLFMFVQNDFINSYIRSFLDSFANVNKQAPYAMTFPSHNRL